MAHSPRHNNDKRSHPSVYPHGTIVGAYTSTGLVKGKVYSDDDGGWIYVEWGRNNDNLPGYLRSTQVFIVEEADAA